MIMKIVFLISQLLLMSGCSPDYSYNPNPPQPIPGSTNYGKEWGPRPFTERPEAASLLGQLMEGIVPNSYYSRPALRFPYYDKQGKGYLLYGYGGKELFEYSVFDMLEGYF